MPITIRMAHSSDADDAFMWWPLGDLATGRDPAIDTGPFRFEMLAEDIEVLNKRAMEQADLDVTAISMHAFAHVADRYAVCRAGNSMGDGYGPKVIARSSLTLDDLRNDPSLTLAVPGTRTTAFLMLRLMLGRDFNYQAMPFGDVIPAVAEGRADAGVVIHEGQITFQAAGLIEVIDEGAWWKQETGLPLPLGANVVKRDLDDRHGAGTLDALARLLRDSLDAAMGDRTTGLHATAAYAHGMPEAEVDRYVAMYVNPLTLDCGEQGRQAIEALLRRGAEVGLCPNINHVELAG